MNTNSKNILSFSISLICAIWFLLTSYLWTYYINAFISLPFGLISFYIWNKGRKIETQSNRYKLVGIILITGVMTSIASLILLKIYN